MTVNISEDLIKKTIASLEICIHGGDYESDHAAADGILCNFLNSIGCAEIVKKYRQVPKWYN